MRHRRRFGPKFFGSTTLGEKGQVVIPAEARAALEIGKGEKLLVFGMGGDSLMLSKVTNLERRAEHLTHRLESLQSLIDSASHTPDEDTPADPPAATKPSAKKTAAKKAPVKKATAKKTSAKAKAAPKRKTS